MVTKRRHETELGLAAVVKKILRDPGAKVSTEALARDAGYGRSHWCRVFQHYVGESPGQFVRRIRLEMAEFRLTSTDEPIEKVAAACGYDSPSAFSRAFARATGLSPEAFRAANRGDTWPSPFRAGVHWTPYWDLERDYTELERRWPIVFTLRPAVRMAARERYGNYAYIGDRYGELHRDLPELGPERRFFTLYWDNLWTHPTADGMRAHIGFELLPGEEAPPGFEAMDLPGGRCVTFDRPVRRTERNEAWAWLTRFWPSADYSFDEHRGMPLPWEAAMTYPHCVIGS